MVNVSFNRSPISFSLGAIILPSWICNEQYDWTSVNKIEQLLDLRQVRDKQMSMIMNVVESNVSHPALPRRFTFRKDLRQSK